MPLKVPGVIEQKQDRGQPREYRCGKPRHGGVCGDAESDVHQEGEGHDDQEDRDHDLCCYQRGTGETCHG